MIAGKDAPTYGEAKNSWLTGTAAWNYVAISQYILGIRPSYAGLTIQPVIPTRWPGFTAQRVFRGVVYTINVIRHGPGNNVQMRANGQDIQGTVIPIPSELIKEVNIEVVLT